MFDHDIYRTSKTVDILIPQNKVVRIDSIELIRVTRIRCGQVQRKLDTLQLTVNEQIFETEVSAIPAPTTTNAMITIAPVLIGNFFSSISRFDGRTACLPLRTSLAKALFLTLMSCGIPGFQEFQPMELGELSLTYHVHSCGCVAGMVVYACCFNQPFQLRIQAVTFTDTLRETLTSS